MKKLEVEEVASQMHITVSRRIFIALFMHYSHALSYCIFLGNIKYTFVSYLGEPAEVRESNTKTALAVSSIAVSQSLLPFRYCIPEYYRVQACCLILVVWVASVWVCLW